MTTTEIKQILAYSPIAKGGQKLASLDKDGIVCIYDDLDKEWVMTNTVLKGVPQQTPDEKVLDYLERAKRIAKKMGFIYGVSEDPLDEHIIEIAKLLQKETNK